MTPPGPDPDTVAAYERGATDWEAARSPSALDRVGRLRRMASRGPGPSVDLGCGPGWHLPALPAPAFGLDATRSMLDLVPRHAPDSARVQADLARIPLAAGSVRVAFSSKAYVHLDACAVPRALADLHRALAPGAVVALSFFGSGPGASAPTVAHTSFEEDSWPGRRFSLWNRDDLAAVLEGSGLETDGISVTEADGRVPHLWVEGRRRHTLADTVGPGMRLLVCGLNPSVPAADAGVGFVTPGNRFWPAALAAGLVDRDRDPFRALDAHGVGMTDLVKRATRRADELSAAEYRDGLVRVERLVRWLAPEVVCFVGLAGYRVAVDREARAGVQERRLGGRPVYLMPSTSGLNTHSRLDELTTHLRRARALAS